jgi:hypothetical protein
MVSQETCKIVLERNDRFLRNSSRSGALQDSTTAASRTSWGRLRDDTPHRQRATAGGDASPAEAGHAKDPWATTGTSSGGWACGLCARCPVGTNSSAGEPNCPSSNGSSERRPRRGCVESTIDVVEVKWRPTELHLHCSPDGGPRAISLSFAPHGGNLLWSIPPSPLPLWRHKVAVRLRLSGETERLRNRERSSRERDRDKVWVFWSFSFFNNYNLVLRIFIFSYSNP